MRNGITGSALSLASLAVVMAMAAEPARARISADDGWQVTVNDMAEPNKMLNRMYARGNVPVFVDGVGFEIERSEGADHSLKERQELIEGWQRDLANLLGDHGFEEIDEDEIEEKLGMTMSELREKFVKTMPFGTRDMTEQMAGRKVFVLMNERACPRPDGVIGAYVIGNYPLEIDTSSYGAVAVTLTGIGGCGPGNPDSKAQLRRIRRALQNEFYQR